MSTAWHALTPEEARRALDSGKQGLSEAQARERLARFGPNRLRPPKRRSALTRFLAQFDNVLIYVLIAAAVVTLALRHYIDAGVILGVVVINAVIGFLQEGKAERALDAIRDMLSPQAMVLRGGKRLVIPAENLVPGDVVLLQSGDKVPADLRLTESRSLQIQESALTGESVPVTKHPDAVPPGTPLGDRAGMAYSGTLVTYGQGSGIVAAIAEQSEIGRISTMLADVEKLDTPLLRNMARFARRLTAAILLVAAATFLVGVLWHDLPLNEMFLAVVGIAVAAIPEGLPAIITITLAIGVQRMAGRNAIIRRLPAVETLGSVTVICTDKTGTLTRNEMTVQSVATAQRVIEVSGAGYSPEGGFSVDSLSLAPDQVPVLIEMARAAALCSDSSLTQEAGQWRVEGDPTEGALLTLAMKAGLDLDLEGREQPRTDSIPFESEHRFMATLVHDHEGSGFIIAKGAPEVILQMCRRQRSQDGGDENIQTDFWQDQIAVIATRGQRALAICARPTDIEHRELTFGDLDGSMIMLGLFGLADPPRTEAIQAVATCQSAGIRVKMITGDHALTARAIGAQVGLTRHETALTGTELDAINDADLEEVVAETDIFARMSPEHKLRLVKALQARGQVLAMTGDGVNDAPALKRADVGVAMGRNGTEAAKEAAEMVLADDNFASIASAVEEGRTIYDNIKKAMTFILPTNGGEAFIIVLAILLGRDLPITAVQILWVNMITAVTLALAIAFEPAEQDVMRRKPRPPSEPILSRYLIWRIAFVSGLLVIAAFGLYLYERANGATLQQARTVAVNALVWAEALYLINSRYLYAPVFNWRGLFGSRIALAAIAAVILFQMLFTYAPPMHFLFDTAPIDLASWGRILAAGLAVFLLVELEKAARRRIA